MSHDLVAAGLARVTEQFKDLKCLVGNLTPEGRQGHWNEACCRLIATFDTVLISNCDTIEILGALAL